MRDDFGGSVTMLPGVTGFEINGNGGDRLLI